MSRQHFAELCEIWDELHWLRTCNRQPHDLDPPMAFRLMAILNETDEAAFAQFRATGRVGWPQGGGQDA